MDLDFEKMEKELETARDPEREAWLRGERTSDKGLTIIFTGFEDLTPAEHAQREVRRAVIHAGMRGANAPKIPSANLAHYPNNCSYRSCKQLMWDVTGQARPFCDEHDTKENREHYGYD